MVGTLGWRNSSNTKEQLDRLAAGLLGGSSVSNAFSSKAKCSVHGPVYTALLGDLDKCLKKIHPVYECKY